MLLSSSAVLFPDAESSPVALAHLTVERALEAAGLERTFVRPGYFATNTLQWSSIRTGRGLLTKLPAAIVDRMMQAGGDIPGVPGDQAADAVPEVEAAPR